MATKFWGKLANALVPGDIYNSHTGQWAPSGVLGGRVAAGVAGQLMGPAGGIAGMVADKYIGNTDQGFAFDQGIEGWQGFHNDMTAGTPGPQLQTEYLQPNVQPGQYGEQQIGEQTQRSPLAQMVSNPMPTGGGRNEYRGPSAGSSVLAEGPAAQNMFAGMRDANTQAQMDGARNDWFKRASRTRS